jgi:predicted outer membrane protein
MGKAKLGSWWAAGAAVCMLVSAGVAAQSTAPAPAAPAATSSPAAVPAPGPTPAPAAAPSLLAVPTPPGAPATINSAPVAQSRHNERGGGDQAALTALHRQNQQSMADARLAQQRGTTPAVRDFATTVISNTETADAKLMSYAQQQGMNVEAIQLAAGALPNGALTRVDLVNSPPERFDADFAAKMVANSQAALDQTQKAQALARAPGMAPMLQAMAPVLVQQQAGAMSLVATLPTPPTPPVMQFLTHPALGTMPTGVDTEVAP